MKAVLVTIKRDGSIIKLWVRNEQGKKCIRVVDFKPYFYVPDRTGKYKTIFGERVRKVVAFDPSDVPKMRAAYEKHFEADIPYTRRFLIDTGVKHALELPDNADEITWRAVKPCDDYDHPLRIWVLDIEVLAEGRMPTPENPVDPVIAVSVYDSYTDKIITLALGKEKRAERWEDGYVFIFDKEFDLLFRFLELYNRMLPDIITGWNISFDVDYLKARIKEVLGVSWNLEPCETFDMLEAYRRLFSQPSYRLKDVVVYEGLASQEEVMTAEKAIDAYRNGDIETLIRYNRADVRYVKLLDDKHDIFGFYFRLKKLTGVAHLEDTFMNSVLIDTLLLRLAKQEGVVLPSKPEGEWVRAQYQGAIVLQPKAGIYENVAVFDMSRYYPSIIISFNISPDTLVSPPYGDVIKINDKIGFRRGKEGIIPKLCKMLLKERERLEAQLKQLQPGTPEYEELKKKRNAVKYLVNAIYGFLGFSKSRLFNVKVAETITGLAREGILACKRIAEEMGYEVIYGDTDSIMIQVPLEEAQELVAELNKRIREYFEKKYGIEECHIRLKFERYFKRVMFKGVKKRYAGWVVWEDGKPCDYILVKGFEVVRTDTPILAKKILSTFFEMVLKGASADEIAEFLRKSIEEFKKAPLELIAIPKGIDKPLDQYKTRPPHVRGALLANMYLGTNFRQGSRVKMLWVKHVKGLPKTDVICFEDEEQIRGRVIVDYDRMIDACIRQKIEDVLRLIGLSWSSIISPNSRLSRWL